MHVRRCVLGEIEVLVDELRCVISYVGAVCVHTPSHLLASFTDVPRISATFAAPNEVDYLAGPAGVGAPDRVHCLKSGDGGFAVDKVAGGASFVVAGVHAFSVRVPVVGELAAYE